MGKGFPQIEISHARELVETDSPEKNLFLSILYTYKEDIDAFFMFVATCKRRQMDFDARSITKIKRNNYFVENLTTVLNLVNSNFKTNPNLKRGNLHCELICDLAGIDYEMFHDRIYLYVKKRAKEHDFDVEELLFNYKRRKILHAGNI